jgi:hypothetical protein
MPSGEVVELLAREAFGHFPRRLVGGLAST